MLSTYAETASSSETYYELQQVGTLGYPSKPFMTRRSHKTQRAYLSYTLVNKVLLLQAYGECE
jgi:hypothetical protein